MNKQWIRTIAILLAGSQMGWAVEPVIVPLSENQPVTAVSEVAEPSNPSSSPQILNQLVQSHEFLGNSSPLSPSADISLDNTLSGSSNLLLSNLISAALPPEATFVTRNAAGQYEVQLDAYFDALLKEVMPATATLGFKPEELVNIEFAALHSRILESMAGLYDFVVLLPTQSARAKLTNLNFAAGLGVQGFGAPVKDDIQGLGEFSENDALIERLNNTFGPLFEANFNSYLGEVNEKSTVQGLAWVDLPAIEAGGINTLKYQQFVLLQEIAHRWGISLSATKSNSNPLGILGRERSHWSSFYDAGTSPMDGLDWQDNGNGTFTLKKVYGIPFSDLITGIYSNQSNAFNDLDLYAMGLLGPQQVTSSFVIDSPKTLSGSALNEESFSDLFADVNFLLNPTIQGVRHNIAIQDITALNGPRTPSSTTSQKNFSVAFVTVKSGTETLTQLNDHRSKTNSLAGSLSNLWATVTRGLSSMNFGFTSAGFDLYRNNATGTFNSRVHAIEQIRKPSLDLAVTTGDQNKTSIAALENQLTQIESLIAPLNLRAQTDPAFKTALGTFPLQVTLLRQDLTAYKSQIQQQLDAASALPSFIQSKKDGILTLVNAASISGILPLGFGASADASELSIQNQYNLIIQNLTAANSNFANRAASLQAQLNQIQAKISPDSTPPTGTFTINGGTLKTADGQLKLRALFTDSQLGPAVMRYSNNWGASWSDFQTYSTANWNVTEWHAQGTNLGLLVQVCDFFWNCSSAESHITYDYTDQTAPTGDFLINNGNVQTSNGHLTLKPRFQDDKTPIASLRYSTNLNQPWSEWKDGSTQEISLETWPPNGTFFRIWMQACDFSWNCRTTESFVVFNYADQTAPTGGFTINGGAETTGDGHLTLDLNFQDPETQVGAVRYSTDLSQPWSDWNSGDTKKIQLETWPSNGTWFTLWVQACNSAWVCKTESRSIQFQYQDSTPPTGSMVINGDAAQTSGNSMTLNNNFQENQTRLGKMRYSTDKAQTWSSFIDYSASWILPFLAPEIMLQVCDVAWNCTSSADTIEVLS